MSDAEMVVDDGTITSHVKRIRKKFLAVDPKFAPSRPCTGWGTDGRNLRRAAAALALCRGGARAARMRSGTAGSTTTSSSHRPLVHEWRSQSHARTARRAGSASNGAWFRRSTRRTLNRFNPVDRPYVARLFLSGALHDYTAGGHRTVEFTAGVRGHAALGRQSQELVHRFVPAPEDDWSRQLPNRLDLQAIAVQSRVLAIDGGRPLHGVLHYGRCSGPT
jgi:hypothetical protein